MPLKYKEIVLFIWILISFMLCSQNVFAQCAGKYMKALPKDTTITTQCANMVLMNLPTFSSYYLAEKRLEELKRTVPHYRQLVDSIDALRIENEANFDSTIAKQGKMLELQNLNTQQAVREVQHLTIENGRVKKHRNIVGGVALGELFILLILLL